MKAFKILVSVLYSSPVQCVDGDGKEVLAQGYYRNARIHAADEEEAKGLVEAHVTDGKVAWLDSEIEAMSCDAETPHAIVWEGGRAMFPFGS